MPQLHNGTRLPFVVAMNCLNGLFNAVWDEESLAETWMRAPDGGAVAAWASSSVTPAATQALVNRELFRLIFQGTYATLGEAVAAAKRVVSSQDLRKSWIFFGDPAMHLSGTPLPVSSRIPASPVVLAAAAVQSRRADSDSGPKTTAADVNAMLDARGEPVRLMDFNGDGRADTLLYAAASGRWAGMFNDAAGMSPRAGTWGAGWQVAAANLNGDSRTDLRLLQARHGRICAGPDERRRRIRGHARDAPGRRAAHALAHRRLRRRPSRRRAGVQP